MIKLFNVMGGKFKFSAQGSDLAPFVGYETKIPFEIKPPLQPSNCALLCEFICEFIAAKNKLTFQNHKYRILFTT